jgi:hypothetical protein
MTEDIDLESFSVKTKLMPSSVSSILIVDEKTERFGKYGKFVA